MREYLNQTADYATQFHEYSLNRTDSLEGEYGDSFPSNTTSQNFKISAIKPQDRFKSVMERLQGGHDGGLNQRSSLGMNADLI